MPANNSILAQSTDNVNFYLSVARSVDMEALSWRLAFSPTLHSVPSTSYPVDVIAGTGTQTADESSVWVTLVIGPGAAGVVALVPGDWYVYAQPTGLAGGLEPWDYVGVLTVNGPATSDVVTAGVLDGGEV